MAQMPAKRKLTTILAADVVGYSRLMSSDEEATFARLHAYREVTDDLVARYGGRVFNTAGDAFLAEFGSAVEAVRCAIAIQEDLRVRNAELPESGQMWFRIGVNVGDVMIEDADLFGDGVNVASRLEGLAEKGGICISGSAFDQVKNKLSIAFDDIGAQQVKNIPYPVPAFRLVPGKVAVAAEPRRGGKGVHRRLAVIALAAVVVLLLAGVWAQGWLPIGLMRANPYDGLWKVTLTGLSGCLDNSPRAFTVTVRHGRIDEPTQLFPKTGLVTSKGEMTIRATDREGNLRATQTATISGDVGSGRLQGHRPSCTGQVSVARM